MKTATSFIAALTLLIHAASAYQLHEWGTFTTVAGSDGTLLTGLQREEEELPAFVHSHFGFENGQNPSWEKFTALGKTHGFAGFTPLSKCLGKSSARARKPNGSPPRARLETKRIHGTTPSRPIASALRFKSA